MCQSPDALPIRFAALSVLQLIAKQAQCEASLSIIGTKAYPPTLFLSTEALPTRAGVVFPGVGCRFLTQHAISRGRRYDEDGDYLTETNPQREVHAVVVDMPQQALLEYASPDTWGALPTFDPPVEEFPTKPVLQVALN